MDRGDLRKVEVTKYNERNNPRTGFYTYTGYFHGFATGREYGESYQIAIIESEDGCINSEYIGNVKFIN